MNNESLVEIPDSSYVYKQQMDAETRVKLEWAGGAEGQPARPWMSALKSFLSRQSHLGGRTCTEGGGDVLVLSLLVLDCTSNGYM